MDIIVIDKACIKILDNRCHDRAFPIRLGFVDSIEILEELGFDIDLNTERTNNLVSLSLVELDTYPQVLDRVKEIIKVVENGIISK